MAAVVSPARDALHRVRQWPVFGFQFRQRLIPAISRVDIQNR
jgi:hypothetical protein